MKVFSAKTDDRTPTDERLRELRIMPYAEYLQTAEWRRRRDRALARALWCCEWAECGQRRGLEVHHKCYDRRGEELDADLIVLCRDHHERAHAIGDPRRLHLKVIRMVLALQDYASLADFIETVKVSLHEQRIPYDPHTLNDTIGITLRDLTVPYIPPRREVDEIAPPLTHRAACRVLNDLKLPLTAIKTMPYVELMTQRDADQAKALEMVLRELEATAARCEALERSNG